MAVTAVLAQSTEELSKQSFATRARASIPTISQVPPNRQAPTVPANVKTKGGKVMATVTMLIITAVVNTMAVTAVLAQSTEELSKQSFATRARASIPTISQV